jgi:hypothetical protein
MLRMGRESMGSMALDPVVGMLIAYSLVGQPTSDIVDLP